MWCWSIEEQRRAGREGGWKEGREKRGRQNIEGNLSGGVEVPCYPLGRRGEYVLASYIHIKVLKVILRVGYFDNIEIEVN